MPIAKPSSLDIFQGEIRFAQCGSRRKEQDHWFVRRQIWAKVRKNLKITAAV